MRRVAITGIGIVSSIGNSAEEVLASLRAGRSGVEHVPERAELGFHSSLAGTIKDPPVIEVSKKHARQMGHGGRLAVAAVQQAIASAELADEFIQCDRMGIIVGSSGNMRDVYQLCHEFHALKKTLTAMALPRTMASSISANLSVILGTRGHCMTLSGACASGAIAIGHAADLIRIGKQDRVIVGGVQEGSWEYDCLFDSLRVFSCRESPTEASRPFDRDRDGLVPSCGAGFVVLEAYEDAKARDADIWAELVGYATNSDGSDMTTGSGVGGAECMRSALADAGLRADQIDYVNAHATSTPVGDTLEARAILEVLGDKPYVSSTKSMTGHEIGAAGSNELIYSLLMLRNGFIAPNINVEHLDEECRGINLVTNEALEARIDVVMSNSFGFGGVNCTLIVKRPKQD
jgi:3-oxoacyl-[acyl-carrier-protein] synthase-1